MTPSGRSSGFVATALARLDDAFAEARDPRSALAMRSYMRDQFDFVGIQSAARTAIARDAFAGLGTPSATDLVAFADACWARDERDYQYVAVKLLRRHVKVLDTGAIDDLRRLTITKSWWDTVDELARNVVGPLVRADPALVAVMDAWIDDENIWLARTAILHQCTFKDATDADRLFRYCLRRAGDTEFFVRKAIGWALRDYSKVDEDAVRAFVAAHDTELSGLSTREALRYWERVAATEARRASGTG